MRITCSGGLVMALGLLVIAGGCHKTRYQASDLPPEMAASKVQGRHRVDLSRLAQASIPSDVIHPGDVLEVTIATGMENSAPPRWPLRVTDNGEVKIPLVGAVYVAGMLLPDAEQVVRQESVKRQVYRDPHVSLLLKTRQTVRVTVVGAVGKPGTYELPRANQDLLAALIAAGGLTEKSSTIVEIRNMQSPQVLQASYNGERSTLMQNDAIRIDLVEASAGLTPEYRIQDGSIVVVREQEPTTIQVIGLVRRPNQFEIPPDKPVRLLDAIALAGGLTLELADKVQIIRQLDDMEEPVVIGASIRGAKKGGAANLPLAPGDVVSVEETPLTFTVGTIQNFVRFGFSAAIPGL